MRITKYILFIFLLTSVRLFAQNNQVAFKHLDIEDGLSQNDVNAIFQDEKGFMWFGTHDGLNKYDGYDFSVFKPQKNESIGSNLIFAISGDTSGNIWIGTTGSGVSMYNARTEKFTNFRNREEDNRSLSGDYVACVFGDSKGNIWVGTDQGLNKIRKKYDGGEGEGAYTIERITPAGKLSDNRGVNCVFEDSEGLIWVGGADGIYTFLDPGMTMLEKLNIEELGTGVRGIIEDKKGNLYIGVNKGCFLLRQGKKEAPIKIYDNTVIGFVIDDYNQIWAASTDGLLLIKDDSAGIPYIAKKFQNDLMDTQSLSKNMLESLYKDRTGLIWVGTNGGGVNVFDPGKKRFRHVRQGTEKGSLSNNKIRSFYEDDKGGLWIGTEGGGVSYAPPTEVDQYNNNFIQLDEPRSVFTLDGGVYEGKKNLWLGSQDSMGLSYLVQDELKNEGASLYRDIIVDGAVLAVYQDTSGFLWAGTYNKGLYRIRLDKKDASPYDRKINLKNEPVYLNTMSNNIVRNIIEDSEGDLWIGTGNGLNKILREDKYRAHPRFKTYLHNAEDSASLSHNYVLALYESKVGDLWVGTFGGGLNKLPQKKGSDFIHYSEEDGLSNNVIKSILEDDEGNLWLGTNKGLSKFDPINETFKNYDKTDGLQSDEFGELAALKRANGEMLFGGVNGFNVFYPNDIIDNTYEPQVVITNFLIHNIPVGVGQKVADKVILKQSISFEKQLSVNYNSNSFSFEFAALHYAAPFQNQYEYKLEGFDETWNKTTAKRRFATYTNIPSGNYRFYVRASNNDGVWAEVPTSLAITVNPPIWGTYWAYGFYVMLVIFLLWIFRRYTLIGVREKHDLVLEHLNKEKEDDLHQMKLSFFTNISHEFRTPLTLILGPLEKLLKSEEDGGVKEKKRHYRLMQRNAWFLLRLVNQLIDFQKIEQGKMELREELGEFVNFMREISEPFELLADKKHINYYVNIRNGLLWAWFDSDKLEKIVYNLLSNAFKFTPEEGEVTVNVFLDDDVNDRSKSAVLIEICDNGVGISPSKLPYIFERFYQAGHKERVKNEGSGIGMAYTKSLVELMGGNIAVESEKGKGTSFKVSFSISKEEDHEKIALQNKRIERLPFGEVSTLAISALIEADIHLKEREGNEKSETNGQPQLLIVDDNPEIRGFIKESLGEGYSILEAVDGEDGIQKTIKHHPDIIISDIMMPKVDGFELCHQLKHNDKTSHIPIILLTAKTDEESKIEGYKTKADAYVMKPFNIEALGLQISNLLSMRAELKRRFRKEIIMKPAEVTATKDDEVFLQKAVDLVEKHMADSEFNVETLIYEMGVSRSHFYLKVKALTDLSSSEFIRTVRLKRAAQLLEKTDLSVKEIIFQTGFNTPSYFTKCFKRQFGVLPSDYPREKFAEDS
ncbi:two-component regulator propeller domain-containing protein [Flammeovirgaceae bacterium SG7u.111]|nr:two-component regulator propeller domain-containing protein [Flammeovirgaceae bacterium SG7u.132]WPO33652.1 two-component regulator propeller domain-containing protein [Flammeovirgaceae bacterium SG7u.111]